MRIHNLCIFKRTNTSTFIANTIIRQRRTCNFRFENVVEIPLRPYWSTCTSDRARAYYTDPIWCSDGSNCWVSVYDVRFILFARTKCNQFLSFFRHFFYTVSFGGCAGLFLGASLLSFIELIYFLTWRVYYHWRIRLSSTKSVKSKTEERKRRMDDRRH